MWFVGLRPKASFTLKFTSHLYNIVEVGAHRKGKPRIDDIRVVLVNELVDLSKLLLLRLGNRMKKYHIVHTFINSLLSRNIVTS